MGTSPPAPPRDSHMSLRVLVVGPDAEPPVRLPTSWGHPACAAHGDEAAIGLIDPFRPHVAILGTDDAALARAMRDAPQPPVRLVALGEVELPEGLFDACLSKTADPGVLRSLLAAYASELSRPGAR